MNISPALAMLVRDPMVARHLKRVLPEMLHGPLGNLRERLREWNRKPARRATVDASVREQLRSEFTSHLTRLGKLLGRDLFVIW